MSDYKTIAVTPEAHAQLDKLAGRFGLTNKDLITYMVQYFTATKVDPRSYKSDTIDISLKKMSDKIDSLDKRVIGFFREQEKTLIKPILSEVQAARLEIKKKTNPASPVAAVSKADLDALSESLQSAFFHLLGKALTVDVMDEKFLDEYNAAVNAEE